MVFFYCIENSISDLRNKFTEIQKTVKEGKEEHIP
jgi:hypothetical protein